MAWSLSERDRPEPEPLEGKLFEKDLDELGEWFGGTWYGKRFNEAQQRDRELDQQLIDQGGPYAQYLKIRNTPNPVEQKILKGISDVTNIDERVTTPATYIGLGAGIRGLSNVKFPRTYSKLTQKRILPKEDRRMINITKDVESIFSEPADIIRKARAIYRHHPDAGWRKAVEAAKQMPSSALHAPHYIPKSELAPFQKGEPLMTTTGGSIDWGVYGYAEGAIPNQVQKASRISPEVGEQVATDLDGFYTRVDKYIITKEGSQAYSSGRAFDAIKKYPMYWRNPHTGGLYKAGWNAREKRLTVRPVTRGFLENQQSSMIQKYANKLSKEQIAKMNADLETAYEDKVQELTDRQNVIDADMPGIIRHAGSMGKDGSSKSAVMNAAMAERNSIITQLENITQGKYYTEHGYYLNSEKIRNQVVDSQGVPIGESTEFQLGDRKNQNPVFEPGRDKGFSVLKTNVETAIDSVDEGFYLYPNLVVNYNPALSGEREYIIRIEDLSTVKMDRDIKGVLSGKPILEINYNDTELVKKLSTTDGIREWLAEKGIEPAAKIDSRKPDPIRVRDSRKPTTPLAVTQDKFREIANQVFIERIPRTIQGLLGFEVPEYEVVKPPRGRPKGSKNKPKPDQLKLDL